MRNSSSVVKVRGEPAQESEDTGWESWDLKEQAREPSSHKVSQVRRARV